MPQAPRIGKKSISEPIATATGSLEEINPMDRSHTKVK
jgi:hypothetical protein